jgi:hypothetical protein
VRAQKLVVVAKKQQTTAALKLVTARQSVGGGAQDTTRSGGQPELAADLDGGRQLSNPGEQDSPSEILRGTPSGEPKFRGRTPRNRQPLSKQFNGNVTEEAYRANRGYQCES